MGAHKAQRTVHTDSLLTKKSFVSVSSTTQPVGKIGAGEDLHTDTESLMSSQEDSTFFPTCGRHFEKMDEKLTRTDPNEKSYGMTCKRDSKCDIKIVF